MLFIKKTPAESCEKTKIKEHLSVVVVNIIYQSFIVKKKKTTKDSRTYKIKTKTVLFQIIINKTCLSPLILKIRPLWWQNKSDPIRMCLFWSSGLTHIDRWKLFDCGKSLRRREKQNQVSLGTLYSILNSPWITRKSKLCYFRKILICLVTNSSKTRHSKDLSCASQRPFRTSWTSKRSCLSLQWIKIYARRNLPKLYNFCFAKSWV